MGEGLCYGVVKHIPQGKGGGGKEVSKTLLNMLLIELNGKLQQ
jgi:hypothetical protein